MIFHENRLLADDSHEISYLILSIIGKDFAKFVVCCSCDWRFKGLKYKLLKCIWLFYIAVTLARKVQAKLLIFCTFHKVAKLQQPLNKSEIIKKYFSCFPNITYVVGTQKNCLNEAVLLSTQNSIKIDG